MRRSCRSRAALFLAALGLAHFEAGAQTEPPLVARGSIVDSTGYPIPYALVRVGSSGQRVSNDSGRFLIPMRESGQVPIEVRRIGYHPVKLTASLPSDTAFLIVMHPAAASLEAVRIEAGNLVRSLELGGFYRRMSEKTRGANTGHFLTPEDIEPRRVHRVTQLLEQFPGVKVIPLDRGGRRFGLFGANRCPMTVYANGMRLNRLTSARPRQLGGFTVWTEVPPPPPEVDEVIMPTSVAGIEIYTRSNAPTEFQLMNGTCGVVVFWTR